MRIEATINNVTYYNEENAFVILRLTRDGKLMTAKGVCPDLKLIDSTEKAKGLLCVLEGNWKKHPKYGDEFDAETITINTQGMFFFLANIVKGLGNTLAKELIKAYGDARIADILDNNPQELLSFKGIKEKKLKKIVESWNKYKSLKTLTEFFINHNVSITSSLLLRIYNHFKDKDAIKAIKENPYCLTDVRGIGFKTADKLALQLNVESYSPLRVKALVDYVLLSQASDNGHTYLNYKQLLEFISEEINKEQTDLNQLESILQDILTIEDYFIDEDKIGLKGYKIQEDYIEQNFKYRMQHKNTLTVEKQEAEKFIAKKEQELRIKLGYKQKEAIMQLSTQGYSAFILCGYAGTGKSTISKIILDFYKEYFFDENDIVTCAFTGMASKRIKEITGYKASTIHSLLGYKQNGFNFNKDNPLPYKVILIDEASMINLGLFYSLLKAISLNTVVIMVGDDAQLPPIGEGNVFSDLLNKDWMPKIKLETIYRQSKDSVLTYFASFIRQGKVPDDVLGNYKDFQFILKDIDNYWALKQELSEKEMKEIRDAFHKELQNDFLSYIQLTIKQYNITGIKKIWDIQVITPMLLTPLGTKALNDVLQKTLNDQYKHKAEIRGYLLKQYDKLIHLKNQNMKTVFKSQYDEFQKQGFDLSDIYDIAQEKRIYNGHLGLVLDIDTENEMFSVMYPEPDGDNTVALYSFDDYHNIIDLGYALTIHKTQGNQFDYVFIPMINSFYIMLNNKLMYTAITRAKKKVILEGQYASFKRACKNIDDTVRNTWLKSL
jgi:exodeoxyribonuclease V alpha subunit